MTYRGFALAFEGAIALVRLEPKHDSRISDDLIRACDEIAAHDEVTAVLLAAPSGSLDGLYVSGAATRRLELLAQPVIACVEGVVAGGGLELALACDIRAAAESASFSMRQVSSGAIPSAGGTQRLPRLVGRAKATEMILLGRTLSARAALECGLINSVAADGGSETEGRKVATRIAAQGPIAVRYAKEAVLRGLDMPLEQALRFETDLTVILQTTADRAEGVRAFVEKRPPRFEGR